MSQPERFAFIAEWYDENAAIIRSYQLLFYTSDNTVEMYDIKNRRIFLKRSKVDNVRFEDLYIGGTINVHSRQLNLVEYADEFTKKQLSSKKEKTLAMIKPDAVSKFGAIIDMIYAGGFLIANAKMTQMTRQDAEEFYQEHVQRPFFDKLVRFMASGPIVVMELMGNNAVTEWRRLLGPTDSSMARSEAPNSVRAKFGTDQTMNACHGSDAVQTGQRETNFFFGADRKWKNTAKLSGTTCCVIKPSAILEGKAGKIMMAIVEAGFEVSALQIFHMEKANAEEFFEVYKGVVNEYGDMVQELCSGPCFALEITGKGEQTAEAFREFVGPADPEIARNLRPKTLRAIFGHNKIKNAVHCTDLPEDCPLEVAYFFQILAN
ncbi:nucleoside diphosphate kinase 7-like [Acanthaster planci]|uniref:Nucleoside diphosphate kinase n=1 Tax=Acanthaster planci TaxID=133434 RepID=A0A8B7Y783_ACAPL|nr:nucleoside diphosphate kinase 7-like [Acanthaster planci]